MPSNNNNGMNSFHAQLAQRTAFEHAEDTDLESLRSPSPTPIMDHRRLAMTDYDSSVSNIAANTDYEGYHEEEDEAAMKLRRTNTLKIIVSAPHGQPTQHRMDNQDERRQLHQMGIKRMRRRYIPSSDMENDSALSDAFSSSEDLTDDDDEDPNHGMFGSTLFLSGNNKNYGVYSTFPYSEASDTDYLSAQSGDFDELTICYHNERNIPFRNKQAMMSRGVRGQYFSDLGASDIGSSDTDYLSDSIPPPLD